MTIALIAASVFIVISLIGFMLSKGEKKETTAEEDFHAVPKFATQHLAGHSGIGKNENVFLLRGEEALEVAERKLYVASSPYKIITTIPYTSITAVNAENHSGIKKIFSLGKFILIGVYAFAWLKKEPKERGYLVIKWMENGDEHAAVFMNEEEGALANVGLARKAILSWIAKFKA